ncbi:putative ABC transporter substrate-binding protein YesO [Bacillus sp. J14TS2]|uniref:ABC transporter substrate-binding protein n=1 Tax=Bacillus sp. J14TS2 TaxID=2807188 RepID=UPI001B09EDB5|nr:extracellular solute-binding protein [Bacillus sp. J14TS2]GIN71478.1 putative ABC transporter substrate-binding protein YesO [Bacillus sp. J14TS2]
MRFIRQFFTVIVFVLSVIFIAGCSGSETGGKEKGVSLTMTYWGGPLEKESVEALIKTFNDQHDDIHVKAQQVNEGYIEKLTSQAASNKLPDLGYFPEGSLPAWVENGRIKDVSELYESGEIGNKLSYSIFQFEEGGPIGGSSVANETNNIYYNKQFFDEQGVDYPPTKAEDAWTWEEFIEVARKFTVDREGNHPGESGFDPKNIETYGISNFTYFYENFLLLNEGGIISEDGKTILLGSKNTIDALQAIQDLMYVENVMPKPSQLSTLPATDTALLTGRVAMNIDGQWAMQELGKAKKEKSLDLGIGVLPKMKKAVTLTTGTPIVVFNSDNANENWEETKTFLTFIMDPENSLPLIQGGLWMPNEESWYTDEELIKKWTNTEIHPEEYKEAVIEWGLNHVVQNPNYYWGDRSKASTIINPGLDQIWNNQKPAKDAILDDILPKLKDEFGDKYEYVEYE